MNTCLTLQNNRSFGFGNLTTTFKNLQNPMQFTKSYAKLGPLVSTWSISLCGNFKYKKNTYCMKKELQYLITDSNGFITVTNAILGSYLCTEKVENIKKTIYEDIDFLWQNYAQEKDSNMTTDAIILKNNLLEYVQEGK